MSVLKKPLPKQISSYFRNDEIMIEARGDDEFFIGCKCSKQISFLEEMFNIRDILHYDKFVIMQNLKEIRFLNKNTILCSLISKIQTLSILERLIKIYYPLHNAFDTVIEYETLIDLPQELIPLFKNNKIMVDTVDKNEFFIGLKPTNRTELEFLENMFDINDISKYEQVAITQGLNKLFIVNDNINIEKEIDKIQTLDIIKKLAELRYPIYDVFYHYIEYM